MPSHPSFEVLVGLGNPGPEYERTFHNAGFLALEELAGGPAWKESREGSYLFAQAEGRLYVLPQTFMNLSGNSVAAALHYFKKDLARTLIVHDDTDLPLGEWKLEFGRGSAGHHGVDSVIQAFGTKDFWRLRIGVRPPLRSEAKAADFVLDRISGEDMERLQEALAKIKVILNEASSPLNLISEG
jgi:peptidyl-tRNA hydrolase, PTH1 family